MKKLITIMAILLMTVSLSFAASQNSGQGGENSQSQDSSQGQNIQESMQINNQNQGDDTNIQKQVQSQNRIQAGEFSLGEGKQMRVQVQENNRMRLHVGNAEAETGLQLMQQQNEKGEMQIQAKLSNGKNAQIKVMPDTASQRALERLQMKNCNATSGCQIELKEVGLGNQTRAAYEVQARKQAKFLGIFRTQMNVTAQVDAENGEVIKSQKPWWAFLASESEE